MHITLPRNIPAPHLHKSVGAVYSLDRMFRTSDYNVRSVYRGLLRETSYITDSNARTYFYGYLVNRFNPFNPHKLDPKNWGTNKGRKVVNKDRLHHSIRKAESGLRTLHRANQGYTEDLEKVLLRAYGRMGKRRRQLISELLRPGEEDLPQNDTELQKLIDSHIKNDRDSEREGIYEPLKIAGPAGSKKLQQFLSSQKMDGDNKLEFLGKKIKSLTPKIPGKNIWGLKLPEKRVVNAKKKFWKETLERVLPPLPAHEWDRLGEIAMGNLLEQPPERRAKAKALIETETKNDSAALLDVVTTPARVAVSTQNSKILVEPLPIAKRTLLRLYLKIWSLSSKMIQDPITGEWTITWGEPKSPFQAGQITQPSMKDAELFEMPVRVPGSPMPA